MGNAIKEVQMCLSVTKCLPTCHLSLTPTGSATDPPPANSPTMQSRLVHQERTQKIIQTIQKKIPCLGKPILVIRSLIRGLQFPEKQEIFYLFLHSVLASSVVSCVTAFCRAGVALCVWALSVVTRSTQKHVNMWGGWWSFCHTCTSGETNGI